MGRPGIDPDQIPPEMWKQMNVSRERFLEIQAHMEEREKSAPAVGNTAPDFEIERLSTEGERTGKRERLSDYRGRPVALAFGSYT